MRSLFKKVRFIGETLHYLFPKLHHFFFFAFRISFGNKVFHCPDCRIFCHSECREKVPLPCIAIVETPRGNSCTTIADYCSKTTPMIPALIIHCVMEVEDRGLSEVGIYRIPGSERDVRALKVC